MISNREYKQYQKGYDFGCAVWNISQSIINELIPDYNKKDSESFVDGLEDALNDMSTSRIEID